jgi:hypothetical protein
MLPSRGRIKIPVHPERGDVKSDCNDVAIRTKRVVNAISIKGR